MEFYEVKTATIYFIKASILLHGGQAAQTDIGHPTSDFHQFPTRIVNRFPSPGFP